jgi:hypothetical protein
MLRINRAYEWLAANTPTASSLENDQDRVRHETVILMALIKVVGDKSYYQADEPDYMQHVEETVEALRQMERGIETGDFDTFKNNLSVVNRKCTECHFGYKD